MTTFLRHRLVAGDRAPARADGRDRLPLSARRDRGRPGRLPAPGQRLVHRDRRRPDHRLEPHRPGVQRPQVLLGAGRRAGAATDGYDALGVGRLEPRADEPEADRSDHRRRSTPSGRPTATSRSRWTSSRRRPRGSIPTSAPPRPNTRWRASPRLAAMSEADVRAAVEPPHGAAAARVPRPAAGQRAAAQPRPRRPAGVM